MSTKSKTKRRDNHFGIIGGCCVAVLAVILIVIAVIVNRPRPIDDSFFVSDGTKYVLSLDSDDVEDAEGDYSPIKTHLVYFYSDDDITGLKIYYEYADAEEASNAYGQFIEENDGEYKEISRESKYIILVANEADYDEVKASDIKKQIEFMDMINRMRSIDYEAES